MITENKELNSTDNLINDKALMNDSFNWIVLITICLGALMVVIDETIVNVALPSIKTSLGFSDASLAWVVNAYLISFGGFLLLTGRIGDLYGNKKLFLSGIAGFTLFSLTSGLSTSQQILLLSRIGQGITGAIISAISLSLIVNIYREPKSRAKALGLFSAVFIGGGGVGVFLGGIITSTLGWHWIFFVNVPIGIIVFILIFKIVQENKKENVDNLKLDIPGAITITLSSLIVVYGIVNGNVVGWFTYQTFMTLFIGILFFILFILIEYRAKIPLIPKALLKVKNLVLANVIAMLWASAMYSFFFLSTLYMQLVLNINPFIVGLTFLPSNVAMALVTILLSEKLVTRYGIVKTVSTGIILTFLATIYLARAPASGHIIQDILPSMILSGIGSGIAFNSLLLAATNDIEEKDSGLVSSFVNMSFVMGGALGLAIISTSANIFTNYSLAQGSTMKTALNSGYNFGFMIASVFIIIAVCLSLFLKITGNNEPTLES